MRLLVRIKEVCTVQPARYMYTTPSSMPTMEHPRPRAQGFQESSAFLRFSPFGARKKYKRKDVKEAES